MQRRVWLGLLLAAGWFAAGKAAAQDDEFRVQDRNLLTQMRDGKLSVKATPGGADAIAQGAKWAALRIADPVNSGVKQGNPKPMSVLVAEAANLIVDATNATKPINDAQREYAQEFGKAVVGHLRTVLGTK